MGVDEDNIDIYRSMEDMVSPAGPTDQVGPHCQKKNVCRYDVEIDTHLKWLSGIQCVFFLFDFIYKVPERTPNFKAPEQ